MWLKTALIIIDMIKDFVTGKLGFTGAVEIVPNIQRLLAAARASRVPVVYVCDSHSFDDPEIRVWGKHAMAGTEGSQVISDLGPKKGEPVVKKKTYTIFYGVEPKGLLKKSGVKELVLTGVVTDICIQNSAAGAFFNGYRVVVPEDCVASPDEKANKYSLDYMKRVYGAKITNSREIIRSWKK
ncbi:MAG: isochorismatase family cysteine hydrolase [Methanobacteriota archaeon]